MKNAPAEFYDLAGALCYSVPPQEGLGKTIGKSGPVGHLFLFIDFPEQFVKNYFLKTNKKF